MNTTPIAGHRSSTTDPPVVIIGGGLAGIAAAVRLADRGARVTLVETRKRLGGRATSFVDPTNEQLLDNCQHVLMGCCTNLIDLYKRLGVADCIAWHRRLYFLDGQGRLDVLEADDLPAPLHMTGSLLAFASLTLAEKLAIARGLFTMMRLGVAGRKQWHDRSFTDWLKANGQPVRAIEKFWSVIIISAVNELPQYVAADYAMQIFMEGFLANEQAYVMGVPNVPLVNLYDSARQVIEAAGGTVLLATSAERLSLDGDQVCTLHIDGGRKLTAEGFVSALPFDRLDKLCPPEARQIDPRIRQLGAFEVSPIIGIHLWFDRPVMKLPHLILTQSPLQWLFNKDCADALSGDTGEQGGKGQHLHGVISAAHHLVDKPAAEIADMAAAETRRALPAAKDARIVHHRVIKEKRATFSAQPGIDAARPDARGAITNLYLAGDWCNSGWPATMEGAVRSGYLAAAALLDDRHVAGPTLVADLKPAAIYRFIGG